MGWRLLPMPVVVDRESSIPLHLQVRRGLRDAIVRGDFPPGQALPSLRTLAQQTGVNKLTMLKAVEGLKRIGLVEAVRGKGVFVCDPLPEVEERFDIEPAEKNRFYEGAAEGPEPEELADGIMETVDKGMRTDQISFAAAFPPAEFLPANHIRLRMAALLKEQQGAALAYSQTHGVPGLRESLCDWLTTRNLRISDHDQVLIVSGAQQAITLALQVLVRPGESVLVESPGYLGVIFACRQLGIRMESVPLDKRGLDCDRLETRLKRGEFRALFCVPNFQNPTGITMSEVRRRRVLDLARSAGVYVIEDDACGDLRFTGKIIPPIKALEGNEHVLYVGSFSKSIAPGLRVGYMVAHRDLAAKLRRMKEVHDICAPTLSQHVMDDMLRSGMYARHLRKTRRAFRKRCNTMIRALQEHLPEQARFTEPKGGLHLWVVLPESVDVMQLQKQAEKQHIYFSPGNLFFADRRGNNCLRLNFASNPSSQIEEGISRLGQLIREAERRH